jgi:protein phosphatase 2C
MEEMSPALAMTLSLGNSMCDNSGIATHVEITRLKLVTGPASLLSDSGKVVSEESLSGGAESCSHAKNELNLTTMTTPDDGGDGETVLLNMLLENKNGSITSDAVIQETEEDEVLSVVEDSNGIIPKGILVLNAASEISLPKSVKMENTKIIAKAIIVESTNEVQVPTAKLLIGAVSPNAEISDGSDIKASAVLLKLPSEKNLIGGPTRSVFELDCIPLWGSVSICGRRSEMEDAVAAVPRFAKVPIKMLIGDRVVDGISESLTHLTSHFYGVYDGHGGAQVHL